MKYSDNYNRDYLFYLNNLENFKFCGTRIPKFKGIYNINGKSAKEVFYKIDTEGKNLPTYEVELLDKLLLTKASVNFQIKQWVEGLIDETLSFNELNGDSEVLEWIKIDDDYKPTYYKNLKELYNLPEWVINAIKNQYNKLKII